MPMLKKLHTPFPFYLNDDRKNTILIACVSMFMFVFLSAVHWYDMPDKLIKICVITAVIFSVLFTNIVWLPRLLPALFDSRTWTLWKYIVFNLWQFLFIGTIGSAVLYLINFYSGLSFADIAVQFYPRVLLYGLVPVIMVGLVLSNLLLQENLRSAIRANQELEKIRVMKKENVPVPHPVLTIYSDTSETLSLKLVDLLFVEADDNYSTFYWMNGQGLEKKMLRVNLKNVESQLDNSFALRCHRSFIVNINKIGHVSGNTNGYKLGIKDTDLSVPVSRSKGKEVIEKIGQLKNSFEIS